MRFSYIFGIIIGCLVLQNGNVYPNMKAWKCIYNCHDFYSSMDLSFNSYRICTQNCLQTYDPEWNGFSVADYY